MLSSLTHFAVSDERGSNEMGQRKLKCPKPPDMLRGLGKHSQRCGKMDLLGKLYCLRVTDNFWRVTSHFTFVNKSLNCVVIYEMMVNLKVYSLCFLLIYSMSDFRFLSTSLKIFIYQSLKYIQDGSQDFSRVGMTNLPAYTTWY